jgi:hypothetical protein
MRTISQALPALATNPDFRALVVELSTIHRMIADHSAGMGDMPTNVLTAACEVVATAPRRKRLPTHDSRRRGYAEVAIALYELNYRPEPTDLTVALGVWGVVLGRAIQVYRGLALDADRLRATPRAGQTSLAADQMCAFVANVNQDVHVMVGEVDCRRVRGMRELSVVQLREFVAAHPELKREPKAPKSRVQLRLAVAG